jgi:hypothetical protein
MDMDQFECVLEEKADGSSQLSKKVVVELVGSLQTPVRVVLEGAGSFQIERS